MAPQTELPAAELCLSGEPKSDRCASSPLSRPLLVMLLPLLRFCWCFGVGCARDMLDIGAAGLIRILLALHGRVLNDSALSVGSFVRSFVRLFDGLLFVRRRRRFLRGCVRAAR